MNLTRTASSLEPAEVKPSVPSRPDGSVANLTARLAHEGMELAAVELRRLGAEMRERRGCAVRAAAGLFIAAVSTAIAIAVLAGAAFLYLGRAWGDPAAAALATGGALLVLALAAGFVLIAAVRRLAAAVSGRREPADDERNPRHVA